MIDFPPRLRARAELPPTDLRSPARFLVWLMRIQPGLIALGSLSGLIWFRRLPWPRTRSAGRSTAYGARAGGRNQIRPLNEPSAISPGWIRISHTRNRAGDLRSVGGSSVRARGRGRGRGGKSIISRPHYVRPVTRASDFTTP